MQYFEIQTSIVNCLKSFSLEALDKLSVNLTCQLKTVLDTHKYKHILIVHNALFEPSIMPILKLCKQMKIKISIYTENNKFQACYFQNMITNSDLKLHHYTFLPLVKEPLLITNAQFDLVITPLMVFDRYCFSLDYDLGLNAKLWKMFNKQNIPICGYAVSVQEFNDIRTKEDAFRLDHIVTEFKIFNKTT